MNPTEQIIRLVQLLLRVPPAARPGFARQHLLPAYVGVAQHFAALPPDQRARTVLFVSMQPHYRETRIADAARASGWNTLLLHHGPCRYDTARHFSFAARVEDLSQLALAVWLFPGALAHVFALRGDHALLLCATKNRPMVVDLYDTCAGFLSATAGEKAAERHALSFADGITMRDLRVKYLERLHDYTLPAERVFIHDPPSDQNTSPEPLPREPDDPIRVVSVGWADGGEHSFLRISHAFCAAGIHVHLYLNPHQNINDPDVASYRELQRENPCFHLEPPVYGADYSRKIRGYDFGLAISERFIFEEPSTNYTPDYLAGCGSSRLTDFIQLGLGVIVSPQFRFQHYWARRYATTTVLATRELLADPLPILRAALAARRPLKIDSITVQGVSARLGRFYERVVHQTENLVPAPALHSSHSAQTSSTACQATMPEPRTLPL